MSSKKTFLILDGNALLHRAWHALPKTMTTSRGIVVNAVYGFATVVEKMRQEIKPDYMVVAWDLPGPTFRHQEFPAYKATREKKEQELYDQIPIIQDLLDCYNIPSLSAEGFEADDVLGTLAATNKKKNLDTLIVTGDLDTLQLVNEKTRVLSFIRGTTETKTYDEKAVRERFRISPKQLIDFKALAGDASDNIAGVPGIGEKGAVELIAAFGSLENLFRTLEKEPEAIRLALRKKLMGQRDHALKMKRLLKIVSNVKLPAFNWETARTRPPKMERLITKLRDLEFRRLLLKYEKEETATPRRTRTTEKKEKKYELTERLDDLADDELAIAVEKQPEDLWRRNIAAVALFDGQRLYERRYPDTKEIALVQKKLLKTKRLLGHDLKSFLHLFNFPTSNPSARGGPAEAFSEGGESPTPNFFDTQIAAYLLNPSGRGYEFQTIVQKFLNFHLPLQPTAEQTAAILPILVQKLEIKLQDGGLKNLAEKIEMPLLPILYQMEKAGIRLDTTFLKRLSEQMHQELDRLTEQIQQAAGREFNVNSPLQLAEVLFTHLKLPRQKIKRIKTGLSTGAEELEKLIEAHPVVPLIMQYRELAKLISTYVDALPELVGPDGRLHTTFNQTATATGRLSSSNPNLQNIPIRTEIGRQVRRAFIADANKRLISADYSQIELRLVAVMAHDRPFIEAFREGADIHTRTAAEVWDITEKEVTAEQRRAAKAINFGIIYGMGPRSLARATGLTQNEARQFIDRYFEIHHAIRDYIDEIKTRAHTDGFVTTLFGRRRDLPEIKSGVPMLVAAAERMAINMPIQGTQADIIKMAMIKVDRFLRQKFSTQEVRLLLQVHDELVFEAEEKVAATISGELKKCMESVATLDVPLVVNIKSGENWGEL